MTDWARFIRNSLSVSATFSVVLCASAVAQPAPNARPTGGLVVSGSASIAQTAAITTINQSSQRAAINWRGFDLGSIQTVQVNAPSSTAVTLMRVSGPDPSQLAGRVTSNGVVVITNASGAAVDLGGQVNAAGFIVSAPGITTKNFAAGKGRFTGAPKANAAITNAGTITVKQLGQVALLAPTVSNRGVINARIASVDLLAGTAATLGLPSGTPDITGVVHQTPVGADGKAVTSLISSSGSVQAAGGHVLIKARATDGIVQSLISTSGLIAAATLGSRLGTIQVNGVGGSVLVGGKLQALGSRTAVGGRIGLLATNTVGLTPSARLNASGGSGGGVIGVGTTLQRAAAPTTPAAGIPPGTSLHVSIPAGAIIAANATNNGAGGRITGLSIQDLVLAGNASVKGGPHGGNGGVIELSTKGTLTLTGKTNVSATPPAQPGTVVLDPHKLIL
jgi:filamentous hemagglutinin family protein